MIDDGLMKYPTGRMLQTLSIEISQHLLDKLAQTFKNCRWWIFVIFGDLVSTVSLTFLFPCVMHVEKSTAIQVINFLLSAIVKKIL